MNLGRPHHSRGYTTFYKILTQDEGIHDDTRDGCSNYEAKCSVDVEVWCESCTDTKDCLDCQADEDDDPPTVPGTGRHICKLKKQTLFNNAMKILSNILIR